MDPGSLSIHHPLLTIPEEDHSTCSDYSVPSDCNCFTDVQKSNEKHFSYQNNISKVIEENKRSLLHGTRKKLSNRKHNNCEETEDSVFTWKLMTIREKLEHTLLNVYLSISNMPEPDGVQDLIRRRQRAAEFTSRFCRNYLYNFNRQVLALQHRLREKSWRGLQPVYRASMSQKLLNSYEFAHQALQAVLNHIPTSILMCIPKKLREFLKLIIELTEISSKSGLVSYETEGSGDEIEKYCRDLLMLTTDSSESLSVQSETANSGYERKTLRNCGKFPLVSRFSMYNEKSSMKRKNTVMRSVSSTKKIEASGKESGTSLKRSRSSLKNSHLSRLNEMPVPRSKLTKYCTRKKKEEHSKLVERIPEKNYVCAPLHMDSVTTIIETFSSVKSEENSTQDEHNSEDITISSEQHKEAINNTVITKLQNKPSNRTKCQTRSNVKLVILPPFEESVSEGRIEQYAPSQSTGYSKNEESANNICSVLNDSGPSKKLQDDEVMYPVEHIHLTAVKDYPQGASLPPQSYEPLHLEKMVTYESKGCIHTQDTGTSPLNETFTVDVIELEEKKSVKFDPPDNSFYLEKIVTHQKEDNSYLQGLSTVSLQRTNTEPVRSISETHKLVEQQGNRTELSDTTSKTNSGISQNVILLKIPTEELECLLEHRKKALQRMDNNPFYVNSAKPWLIVSRLADTVISDILHEIISEIESEVDKITKQMFHLELQ